MACGSGDSGHQQSQIVVNFGNGPYRTSRACGSLLLIDAQGGLQAANRIDIWALHLVQKLTSVARQAFHVLALTFCEQCVESQGTLAATADARDDSQLTTWYIQVDVFKIVSSSTSDLNKSIDLIADWLLVCTFGDGFISSPSRSCRWLTIGFHR